MFFLYLFLYSLDTLLDGGFYTSEITEVIGPPAVGKSQVHIYVYSIQFIYI